MSSPLVVAFATVGLIALSAFFVAVEFASLAARRHRLEDAAGTSRAARTALRNSAELTVLLAGSQLGITACTLALGAVTKPAVHYWATPVLESLGAPPWVADVAGFVIALVVVTFLHLVVGEMAPQSWAIAHPESSATLLAVPMRAFIWLTRPILRALNEMANWCLRKVGVDPADTVAAGQNAADLRHLVEHSANVGALDAGYSAQLGEALELQSLTLADLVHRGPMTSVPPDATVEDVRRAARLSGHLRILVGSTGVIVGVVHVRDTLTEPDERPAADLMRPAFTLTTATPFCAALTSMRETRNHLAVVTENGAFAAVITLSDVLARLFPPSPGAAARRAPGSMTPRLKRPISLRPGPPDGCGKSVTVMAGHNLSRRSRSSSASRQIAAEVGLSQMSGRSLGLSARRKQRPWPLAGGPRSNAMPHVLAGIPMPGTVVIGEGDKDEAPMLANGEVVGDGTGPEIDIAWIRWAPRCSPRA